jgi:ribosomal protein S18 acetylase RimI-like enzyme
VIHYRTFRNVDPPGLVDVWNESFPGRGAVPLRGTAILEFFTFAKPYFDPAGLVLAFADNLPVGFAHAGFGPNEQGSALSTATGVVCLIGVVPPYRRQGIGAELLRRCEEYLRGRGAATVLAGPRLWLAPFTFGLYGGSASPGFLESDPLARPFLEKHGYRAKETTLVFQRSLEQPLNVADPRFVEYRRTYEVHAGPRRGPTWWQECVIGPVEVFEFRLVERATGRAVARTSLWEMETFSPRWNEHSIGLIELEVLPELRRRGFGKFLLAHTLRLLNEQFFTLAEMQAPATNEAAVKLLSGLGFQQVDKGHQYRREEGTKIENRG